MEDRVKTCAGCAHAYRGLATPTRPSKPDSRTYLRCRKGGAEDKDDSLCGVMRRGACGPDADLWETRDGQA